MTKISVDIRPLVFTLLSVALLAVLSAWPSGAAAHPSVYHATEAPSEVVAPQPGTDPIDLCCHYDGTCTSKVTLSAQHIPAPWGRPAFAPRIPAGFVRASLPGSTDPPPPRA
jgi:hypothetical protein